MLRTRYADGVARRPRRRALAGRRPALDLKQRNSAERGICKAFGGRMPARCTSVGDVETRSRNAKPWKVDQSDIDFTAKVGCR